jgi:hypothetical protein
MFIHTLRQRAGRAWLVLPLGIGLGLLALHTGCSKNDSSYDNPAPAISAFTTGTMNGTTFTATPAGSPMQIPVGGTAWFRANFGVKDGSAVVAPGNVAVTTNVAFPITNITATTTYTLTVTSGGGQKATATATVTVLVAPSALTYANEDATYYAGVQIANNAPTVSGAAPITYSVNPALPSGLTLNATTGVISGTPVATTAQGTYTVTATNAVGSTTRDIKITVAPTPISFSLSPTTLAPGSSTTLTWDANSIAGVFSAVTITANPADATLPATFALSGTANVTPVVTTTYTLSATPAGGGAAVTRTADVTVGSAPVHFTSFTATPTTVVLGKTSDLAWSYTGLALDLTLNGANVLGSVGQTITPYGRQKYTLAGANLLGGDTAVLKVGAKALYHVAGSYSSGRGNVDGGLDPNGASTARFYRPNAISWDEKANDGSMIVCDYSSNLVRRIAANRTVTTIAGTPGVAGTATTNTDTTTLYQPRNTAVDPVTGDVYLGGEGFTTKRLLKLTPNADGTYTPSILAGFTYNTNALVIDSNRMMYFVEYSATTGNLYKMDLTAGAPTPTLLANLAPTVTSATALAKDFNGGRRLLYLVGSSKIFKIDISNEASPVATLVTGTGTAGFLDTLTPAVGNTVNAPQGIAVDTAGNVYIADRNNFAVRMIPAGGEWAGTLLTIAGATGTAGEGYGSATVTLSANPTLPSSAAKTLSNAYYVAVQGSGAAGTKIYVADAAASFDNQAIRVITVGGTTTGGFPSADTTYTLDDPTKPAGYAYAGAPRVTGNADGVGAFAKFNFGTGSGANLATLPDGSLTFAADTLNNAVRIIAADGTVTTLKDATATNIAFLAPKSVAVQVNPSTKALVALFVGDTGTTKKLRKFTPNVDGTFTEATYVVIGGTYPVAPNHLGLAVDSVAGFVYATDATAAKVFKIDASSGASTDFVAATGTTPAGIALAPNGTVWVAVTGGSQVKQYDTTGTLALTVGTGTAGYADGAYNAATFTAPTGITVDGNGFAYVTNYATGQTVTTNGIRAINTSTGAVITLFGYATSTTTPTFYGMKPGLLLPDNLGNTAAQSLNGGVIYAPQGLTVNQDGDLLVSTPQSVYKVVAPANQ